jgi:hypothetical protein
MVDTSKLEVGHLMEVSFGTEKVGIYRRSTLEVNGLSSNPALGVDDEIPGWWPRNKTPLAAKEVATSTLRSLSDDLFVFWLPSSVYGCYVKHLPKNSSIGKIISKSWAGGFFDPCNGVGYDYAGRSVVQPKVMDETAPPKTLTSLSLMIPPYQVIKSIESIVLKCS